MADTHVTAPTRFVQVGGVKLAYRRFGKEVGTPLLFLQHFRGSMDNWDPAVTDGFAQERPVILYDNTGVSGSSGETPSTVEGMTEDTAAFLRALGISSVDLLGFSMGGYTAQTLSLKHPTLVRKLVLVATGPRGGEPSRDPKVAQLARGERTLEEFLYLFFSPSATSQAAGRAFWERRHLRQRDVDPLSSPQTMAAQTAAGAEWRAVRGERYAELKNIAQPTLVVNGNRDIMIPTINAYTLSQHIPNAQLIVYPDSGHGSLFQYPELFVRHVTLFLEGLRRTDG
jgi:pimeloyl-ACP methyl ester carboxylesterase